MGVGSDEAESLAEVACTHGGCGKDSPEHIIPARGQSTEDSCEGASRLKAKESWRVFKDCEAGSKLANDAEGVRPEPAVIGAAQPFSKEARRLARHAACKEVNRSKRRVKSDGADVAEVGDVGPMVREDEGGVRVGLGMGDGAESDGFGGEGKASDAGEEVEVGGGIETGRGGDMGRHGDRVDRIDFIDGVPPGGFRIRGLRG